MLEPEAGGLLQSLLHTGDGADRAGQGHLPEIDGFLGRRCVRGGGHKGGGSREIASLSQSFIDMAQRLSDRSDYISNFAAHVSHELKTPLTSIQGAAELLRDAGDTMTEEERARQEEQRRREQEQIFSTASKSAAGVTAKGGVVTKKRSTAKVGRNDPCPCGSGKKYKKCHGK